MRKIFTMLLFGLLALSVSAQTTIVSGGRAKSRLVVVSSDEISVQAAELFQRFVERISGVQIPIVESNVKISKGDILLNGFDSSLGEDGFRVSNGDGYLRVTSGGDKGFLYGVVDVLEKYMGVRYYAADAYTFQKSKDIVIPVINYTDKPAFSFRQTHSYGNQDPDYQSWFRLENAGEIFAGGLWVHTFDRILSSDEYGKSNPEFFAMVRGERRPGKAAQWCLTNPQLLEVVAGRLDSIFKANPQCNIISVSQMDGNYTNCTCPKCQEITDYEGAISGTFVHFMNSLGERFPDKQISTLAYLFTMVPPKHVKPRDNVNIMLCDIDCMREVSLTENSSGQYFMQALEGWSQISNNIFIWDYGINFDNQVSPFPNFHILQDNIQIFKEHNATMLFEQVNGSVGTHFAELRAYMLGKLMWNPYQNADSLMREFLDGYYGEASPYMYQYLKLQEGALLDSEKGLWIYDSPVTHKDGMLKPVLMRRYDRLFDDAERVVSGDSELLRRVRLSRLPLQYAKLEIARTQPVETINADELRLDIALFKARTAEYGVRSLNERSNSPQDYCDLYIQRYLPRSERNLAAGSTVTYVVEPTKPHYAKLGLTALTDELYGGTTFTESWVGWEGTDGEFILDMNQPKEIQSIETDCLHQLGQWIFYPSRVEYSTSVDGVNYTPFGAVDMAEDKGAQVKFDNFKATSPAKVNARYVKVKFTSIKSCPSWHYGIGYPAWVFIDEVTVL